MIPELTDYHIEGMDLDYPPLPLFTDLAAPHLHLSQHMSNTL